MVSLRVEGLRVSHGDREVLRGVDLAVSPGTVTAVLGASGAGKSTLLRAIAGLDRPDAGAVLIDGEDVTDRPTAHRDLAMVFQQAPLDPTRDLRANLRFPLRVRRVPADEAERRVVAEARAFSIASLLDRLPGQLSEGQRHAAATARSLVRAPRVLLLDEPLADLDPPSRARAVTEIRTVQAGYRATMVIATNDQAVAAALADTVVVLADGVVAQTGSYVDLHEEPTSVAVAALLGDPPMTLLEATLSRTGRSVRLSLPGLSRPAHPPAIAALADGARVTAGIRPEHVELGDEGAHGAATVEQVGLLGPDGLVTLLLDDARTRLAARVPRPLPRVGDRLPVRLVRVHVYDSDGRLVAVVR